MKHYYLLLITFIALFTSCSKKEAILPEPGVFASVKFDDPFGVFNGSLKMLYQGQPIEPNAASTLTVLPGEGKFEFFNGTTKVLERNLNISKDKVKNYVFFKPDPTAVAVELVENNQSQEAKPAEDFIKVKIANFAQSFPAFGIKNIKIVFSQADANFDYIPVDTISTRGREYTDGYATMARAFTIRRGRKIIDPNYQLTFLDENDAPILSVLSGWGGEIDKTVYTLFIAPNANGVSLDCTALFVD